MGVLAAIVDAAMIKVTDDIAIAEGDIVFKFSRSSGPGGQNVNKVNTRVTLLFDLAKCNGLSDEQKRRVARRLSGRVTKDGILRVVSQRHRTQKANREAALERLVELLRGALAKKRVRKQTSVSCAEKQRRLAEKKRRSLLKQQRKPVSSGDIDG